MTNEFKMPQKEKIRLFNMIRNSQAGLEKVAAMLYEPILEASHLRILLQTVIKIRPPKTFKEAERLKNSIAKDIEKMLMKYIHGESTNQ